MKLTDDQIWDIWNSQGSDEMNCQEASEFARAIEAEVLRGITGDRRGEANPVAWAWGRRDANGEVYDCISDAEHALNEGRYTVPLYTSPPQQEQAAPHPDEFTCPLCFDDPANIKAAPGAVQDGWNEVSKIMPKSSQVVLALQTWDHSGKQSIIRACWIPAKTEEADPESEIGEYDEATDTYWEPEGWYEQMSHWGEYSACTVNGAHVTHWRPLPPAPKAQEPGA